MTKLKPGVFRNILVPTDLSDVSLQALDYACHLGMQLHANITLLNVIESFHHNIAGNEFEHLLKLIQKDIEPRLREIADSFSRKYNIEVNAELVNGKVYRQIENTAANGKFDLLVMGSHGATGPEELGKFVLGSNAYRTIMSVSCPVISLNNTGGLFRLKRIMLPMELYSGSMHKLDFAAGLALAFDAEIYLLSTTMTTGFRSRLNERKRMLNDVATRLQDLGIKVRMDHMDEQGNPEVLMQISQQIEADIMIIVTESEHPDTEFVISPAARSIISSSELPVMSIPPQLA